MMASDFVGTAGPDRRRVRRLTITEDMIRVILLNTAHGRASVCADWPNDAMFVGYHWDNERLLAEVVVWSSTFDPVPTSHVVPEWMPRFTSDERHLRLTFVLIAAMAMLNESLDPGGHEPTHEWRTRVRDVLFEGITKYGDGYSSSAEAPAPNLSG